MAFFFKSSMTTNKSAADSKTLDSLVPADDAAAASTSQPSKCQECGFQFQDDRYKEDHRRWHDHTRITKRGHGMHSKDDVAISCGIKSENVEDLLAETAAASHQPEMVLKPFACEYCGWRFILKKDMIHHVRTHTGEKPYACSECDKRFSRAHSLTQHKRVHSKEAKSFPCDQCPKHFSTKSLYETHCKHAHKEQVKSEPPTSQVESMKEAGSYHIQETANPKVVLSIAAPSSSMSSPASVPAEKGKDEDTDNTQQLVKDTAVERINKQVTDVLEIPLGGGKRGIRFTCQFCGWGFWDKKDKKQHEWTHTGHKPYHCTECDKSFSRTYTLRLHLRSHTGERPYSCQYCNKTFTGASSLRLHTQVHTKVHRHRCTMCPKSFKRVAVFRDHQREHLNSDPVMFARCYSSSSTQSDSLPCVSKKGADANVSPHPVSLSLAQLPVSSQEESGDMMHETSATSVQSQGGVTPPIALPPQDHLQFEPTALDPLPSMSEELHGQDRKTLIHKYSKLISGPKRWREPRFVCQYCDKAFHDKKDCRQHENTHTGYKPYECNICGKKLSRHYSLKVHMMSHTGNKPYPCSYCSATFRDRSGQRSHELTHAKSKRYECKICEKTFKQECAFARHLQVHMAKNSELFAKFYPDRYDPQTRGEIHLDWVQTESSHATPSSSVAQEGSVKNKLTKEDDGNARHSYRRPLRYNCSYCTQRFRDKKDWRQHENTHTGFKPYSCKVCGKKLSRQYSLKKHMLTHSGEKPVACAHCKKTFRHRSGLLLHQKNHHPWVLRQTCCLCKMTHKELDDLENHIRDDHGNVVGIIATKFFGEAYVHKAAVVPVFSEQPNSQGDDVISTLADPVSIAIRYLSKRDQEIDQATSTAVDNWLKVEGREIMNQRPKFKCNFCGKGFRCRKDWQQHENSHTGYKPYTCNICGKKLSRLHSLKAHLLTHSKVLPYICHRCGKGFKKKVSLVRHEALKKCKSSDVGLTTNNVPKENVEEYEKVTKSPDVGYHQVPTGPFFFKHEEPKPVVVEESPSSFGSKHGNDSRLKSHAWRCQCIYCGWRFSDFNVFRRHRCRQRRLLRGRNKMSCSNCKEVFITKEKLGIHIRSCGFLCSICNKSFKTKDKLDTHKEVIHAEAGDDIQPHNKDLDESKGTCSISAATAHQEHPDHESKTINLPVNSGGNLADNLLSQEAPRQGLAEVTTEVVSSKKYPSPASTPGRRKSGKHAVVTCRVCNKNFSHRYALKLHLMMHASEMQHKCGLCTKCFSSKKGLKEHRKSHLSPQTASCTAMDANIQSSAPVCISDAPLKIGGVLIQELLKPGSHLEVRRSKSQTLQAKPHKCVYCGWGFWTRKDCIIHERTHTGEKPYICDTCGKCFARSYSLKLHALTHDGMKPFRCSYCNKGFSSGGYVKIHERIHTKEKPYGCRGCEARFSCSSSLTRHEKSCRLEDDENQEGDTVLNIETFRNKSITRPRRWWGWKPHVCIFCGWHFRDMSRMQRHTFWHRKRHFVIHHQTSALNIKKETDVTRSSGRKLVQTFNGKELLCCNLCGKPFRGPNAKRFHYSRVHAIMRPFSCVHCHKGFLSQRKFESHLPQRCSFKRRRVNSCQTIVPPSPSRVSSVSSDAVPNQDWGLDLPSAGLSGLQVSQIVSSNKAEGWIQLKDLPPQNQQGLINQNAARMAVLVADDEGTYPVLTKRFPCPFCTSTFAKPHALRQHVRIHTGEKSFLCQECGKAFTQKVHLKQHMLIHTGEKRFKCLKCVKGFSHKHQLARHVLTHTEQPRPYGCQQCPMKCKSSRELAEHQRVHSEHRPHVCEFCGKSFKRNRDKVIHERIHTGERPFQCPQCDKSFAKSYPLKRHLRYHTGERPYKCDVCSQGFNDVSNLKCHQKKHARQGSCNRCGLIFKSKESLEQHLESAICSAVTSQFTETN